MDSRAAIPPASPPDDAPPFSPGDRVRCLVSTVAFAGMPELRGRRGIVQRVAAIPDHPLDPAPGGWLCVVVWDGLRGGSPWYHRADELAPV